MKNRTPRNSFGFKTYASYFKWSDSELENKKKAFLLYHQGHLDNHRVYEASLVAEWLGMAPSELDSLLSVLRNPAAIVNIQTARTRLISLAHTINELDIQKNTFVHHGAGRDDLLNDIEEKLKETRTQYAKLQEQIKAYDQTKS